MNLQSFRKGILFAAGCLALWLGIRYLLPLSLPFLLGAAIALAAEPGVRLLQKKLHWHRVPAVGVCVSLTLVLTAGLLWIIGAFAVRELAQVTKMAPVLGSAVGQSLVRAEDWLINAAELAPEELRPALVQTVLDTFQNGTALIRQVTEKLPGAVAEAVGWVSQGALTVGTGVPAGFLISVRLPKIRQWMAHRLPQSWYDKVIPGTVRVKKTFGGWLRAQLKLACVTWAIVSVGFFVLKMPYAIGWAGAVALVDAVPVLGTGTVLVPWAVIELLLGNTLRGLILLGTFGATWLARSILEPRLVGRSLGIDPLLSLAAFYVGFKLWGVPGMILAPMTAALLKGLLDSSREVPFKNNL